jgi:hypothetical protein
MPPTLAVVRDDTLCFVEAKTLNTIKNIVKGKAINQSEKKVRISNFQFLG